MLICLILKLQIFFIKERKELLHDISFLINYITLLTDVLLFGALSWKCLKHRYYTRHHTISTFLLFINLFLVSKGCSQQKPNWLDSNTCV